MIAYQKTDGVKALRSASRLNGLHEGVKGLAATDDERPALLVADVGVGIDAEAVINRGSDIGRDDGVGGGIGGGAVRGAVHLPAANDYQPFDTFRTDEPVIEQRMKQGKVEIIIDSFMTTSNGKLSKKLDYCVRPKAEAIKSGH